MLRNTTWKMRSFARQLDEELHGADRYVDIGVILSTVVADPSGQELIPGRPKMRIVATRSFGGILDTRLSSPALVGPSLNPQRWYCSAEQYPVILHADTDPLGSLTVGSMGAGKTTALVMWHYMRWLETLGARPCVEYGCTAPTEARLDLIVSEIQNLYPDSWYTLRSADGVIDFVDGTRIRLVSTYQQSKAQGSRVAGYNWSGCSRDETQDQVDEHDNIEARLRSARYGRAKQLLTATAKDDSAWRDLRDRLEAARDARGQPLWQTRKLLGQNSPFVHAAHWDRMRASISKRRWDQIAGAKDVGPERAVYPSWDRQHNLITVPELGWTDVTALELRSSGDNLPVLAGHDPGTLWDVTTFVKAFVRDADKREYDKQRVRPMWVVVGELTTEESTTDAHLAALLPMIRERWGLNLLDRHGRVSEYGPQLLVRCDPAGTTDTRTDKSVYTLFRNHGIYIKPAAYNADGDGHGRVPKEPGIELVNTLLCNAETPPVRRLFVARNPDGTPCAPNLVKALEQSERALDGKAETEKKTKKDLSHWPASLRYALWALERPRLAVVRETGGRSL